MGETKNQLKMGKNRNDLLIDIGSNWNNHGGYSLKNTLIKFCVAIDWKIYGNSKSFYQIKISKKNLSAHQLKIKIKNTKSILSSQ